MIGNDHLMPFGCFNNQNADFKLGLGPKLLWLVHDFLTFSILCKFLRVEGSYEIIILSKMTLQDIQNLVIIAY